MVSTPAAAPTVLGNLNSPSGNSRRAVYGPVRRYLGLNLDDDLASAPFELEGAFIGRGDIDIGGGEKRVFTRSRSTGIRVLVGLACEHLVDSFRAADAPAVP